MTSPIARNLVVCAFVLATFGPFSIVESAEADAPYPILDWVAQLGTTSPDASSGVSADALNNMYILGNTSGTLNGTSGGESDIFLAKYDADGTPVWIRQFGAAGTEVGLDVSAKEPDAIYFSGTVATTPSGSGTLVIDAFLGKYDSDGNLEWTRSFSTEFADRGTSVAADGTGNVYFAGGTGGTALGSIFDNQDAFLKKYDADGTLLWSRTLATTAFDSVNGASTDPFGNVYIGGLTRGALGGLHAGDSDGFVSKFDADGTNLWTKQIGTSNTDYVADVASDAIGNVYVVGTTYGSLAGPNSGITDVFLQKYNGMGDLQWSKQFGTASIDQGFGAATDEYGNVLVTGARVAGPGNEDGFVNKFDSAGNLIWSLPVGTTDSQQSHDIATDSLGNAYVTGSTEGSWGAPSAGNTDAFLAKIAQVPEPTSQITLFALGLTFRPRARRYSWRRQVV